MFAAQPLEGISLNAIAREANVSKANIYRYFESREEVFLQLTLESLEQWTTAADKRLAELDSPADGMDVGRVFSATFLEHPRFARLSSVMTTVLEKNVSTDAIVEFKLAYMAQLDRLHQALSKALDDLEDAQIGLVIKSSYLYMVSMWPASHPNEEVAKALERPELESMCMDFEKDYPELLALTIKGVRAGD